MDDRGAVVEHVRARRLQRAAGILSLAAGAIHGLAAPAHLEEWWGYGLFFLFAAAAQSLLGLALLTDAINARDFGRHWAKAQRRLYAAGIAGNAAIIALYLVTRTAGIPWVGPEKGLVEGVGLLDALSKAFELALIVLLARLHGNAGKTARPGPAP